MSKCSYAHSCCRPPIPRCCPTNLVVSCNTLGKTVRRQRYNTKVVFLTLHRLRTLKQLFRIILDVTNPSFVIGDRQWQSSATTIFYSYFTAMWQDPQVIIHDLCSLHHLKTPQEEVKFAVDTWSQTLLPAHFEAITNCWNEALIKAPVSERVRLINFLIKLQSLFSSWRGMYRLNDMYIRTLSHFQYFLGMRSSGFFRKMMISRVVRTIRTGRRLFVQ